MSMKKIRLVGHQRYNFKGELYIKGKVYMVGESKAAIMLRKEDGYGRPVFVPYVAPAKTRIDRIAEAAAAAAIAAAKAAAAVEEEIIERPDGSETPEEVVEVDSEAAVEVEVDKDDDPELDEDDVSDNPEEVKVAEEVKVEEEEEDRGDGTEVEV